MALFKPWAGCHAQLRRERTPALCHRHGVLLDRLNEKQRLLAPPPERPTTQEATATPDAEQRPKPIVIVTRKLPDVVETRMRELFDARLNVDDMP